MSKVLIRLRLMAGAVWMGALLVFAPEGVSRPPEGTGSMTLGNRVRRVLGSLSWDDTVRYAGSPRDVCWQVRGHVAYSGEKVSQWYDGWQTWSRGSGDCKAMACCVKDLCDERGFLSWIYAVVPDSKGQQGHMVVMGYWSGVLWMSSNGYYAEVESEEHALRKLRGMMGLREGNLTFHPLSLLETE